MPPRSAGRACFDGGIIGAHYICAHSAKRMHCRERALVRQEKR
jgi:hypothetical protein